MTTRRELLVAGVLGAITPAFASAQQRPVKIGILSVRAKSFYTAHIMKRLAELGYVEGSGTTLEYRHADGVEERFPRLARELMNLGCDIIFAVGAYAAALALRNAGSKVPVVFLAIDYDPRGGPLLHSFCISYVMIPPRGIHGVQ